MKKLITIIIMALTFNTANAYDYNNNGQESNNNNAQKSNNSNGFQPDAYGPGVGKDTFGRAVKHEPFMKLEKDAYGMGVSKDQFGRPVKTDLFGTPIEESD